MPTKSAAIRIRSAGEGDLPALYELAQQALVLDSFSPHLLAEKLFKRPRPQEFSWEVYLAESHGRPVGMMQTALRPAAGKAWIGLFAVPADFRRRGIASALFKQAKADWPPGVAEVEVLAIPGNYFAPGLDPRYTEAVCFLERLGFERFKDCVNLTADLSKPFDTTAEQSRLAADGIAVRRAGPDDNALVDGFFAVHFGADWRFEVSLAMENNPPGVHLALRSPLKKGTGTASKPVRDNGKGVRRGASPLFQRTVSADRIMAFSAHSGQNREWGFFGPMGTAPEVRGKGVGRVLLWQCLNDLRDAGHHTAVIPWVGPIAFYQQWAGCRVNRVFWRYRLACG